MTTLTVPVAHAVHRVARDHCLAPSRTVDALTGGARYGRMFPGLPALPEDLPALETAGRTGGFCDAAALLGRAGAGSDDAAEAAGWPFFGQVVAHDTTADRSPVGSLAVRDLLRGAATGLPGGEAVAAEIGVAPLSSSEVGPGWPDGTPLWFYVLKEAEHRSAGDRLGPVGGRIVAEVLVGLVRADGGSWLGVHPGWRPTLPHAGSGFTLADLLVFSDAERVAG